MCLDGQIIITASPQNLIMSPPYRATCTIAPNARSKETYIFTDDSCSTIEVPEGETQSQTQRHRRVRLLHAFGGLKLKQLPAERTTSMSIVKYWLVWILSCSAFSRALSRVKPEMSANRRVVENRCGGKKEKDAISLLRVKAITVGAR